MKISNTLIFCTQNPPSLPLRFWPLRPPDFLGKLFNSGEQSVESLLKDALVGSDLAGRDLEARDALADLISHIIGGGDQSIESIIRGDLGILPGMGVTLAPAPDRLLLIPAPAPESTLPIEASDSDEPPSTLIPAPAPESTLPVGARAFDEAPSTSVSAAASVSIGAPSTDEAPSDSDDSDVSADGEVSNDSGLADGVPADGIEARGFLGSLLSKLIGAGEQSIESLLKGALLGGQVQRRGFFTLEGETLAEKGIGAILSKLFGKKRALADLSDEEVVTREHCLEEHPTKQARLLLQTSALADLDDDEVITLLRHVASKNSQSEHAFSDLSDDEVITLLKYVASKSPKREKSLNDLD
ncbi:hypothetical protein B0H14DRAFT_3866780 [Mycena olivaceomarginata]|nr:hypothetical protein B0H14DRAFT_3866780 [Mycena olivaceomarginata]